MGLPRREHYPFYEVNRVDIVAILGRNWTTFGGGYVSTDTLETKVILAEDFESANRFGEQQQQRRGAAHPRCCQRL